MATKLTEAERYQRPRKLFYAARNDAATAQRRPLDFSLDIPLLLTAVPQFGYQHTSLSAVLPSITRCFAGVTDSIPSLSRSLK